MNSSLVNFHYVRDKDSETSRMVYVVSPGFQDRFRTNGHNTPWCTSNLTAVKVESIIHEYKFQNHSSQFANGKLSARVLTQSIISALRLSDSLSLLL